jgi:CRP-like cAMP-binding protein
MEGFLKMEQSELKNIIKSHFPNIKEQSLNSFVQYSSYLKSTKGTILIAEGKRHNYSYFLIRGSAKSYYLKDAKEVCMWFAFDGETIGTLTTYAGLPSKETIELLEDSELIRLDSKKIRELAQRDLSVIHMIKDLILEHALDTEERLYQLQFMTSQERYQALLKTAPEILQKVSLTDIASYLGVSRETLSRIRAQR